MSISPKYANVIFLSGSGTVQMLQMAGTLFFLLLLFCKCNARGKWSESMELVEEA